MKKFGILFLILIYFNIGNAQINVRVKSSGNNKEVDIKTGGKPNSGKDKETGNAGNTEEQKQPAVTKNSGNAAKDTSKTPVPIATNDDTYNGPAKSMVASFYRQVDEVKKAIENGKKVSSYYSATSKLKMMETNMRKIKEKDPGYSNIAQFEQIYDSFKKEVEGYEKDLADNQAAKEKEFKDKITNENLLQTVIDGTQMQVGHNNLPFVDKAMADYKAKADEVLKLDLLKYKVKLDDLKRYVDKSHTLAADRIIASAKTVLGEVKDAENFTPIYKELQFRQLYWDAVRKIYKGDATCEKYYKDISDMLAKTGSPADIRKTASKNAAEAIKSRKMAAPVVKDAAMEKILMNGFNSKYKSKYNGTALKAVLLQDGWTIERNDLTGIVTGRNRVCELAYKGADGKCYLLPNPIYIYQAYVGGSFTNTEVIYNGFSGEEMLCENVK